MAPLLFLRGMLRHLALVIPFLCIKIGYVFCPCMLISVLKNLEVVLPTAMTPTANLRYYYAPALATRMLPRIPPQESTASTPNHLLRTPGHRSGHGCSQLGTLHRGTLFSTVVELGNSSVWPLTNVAILLWASCFNFL